MLFDTLNTYFAAEKQGGWLLVGIGLTSFILAGSLYLMRSSFLAMALPLILVGLLAESIGTSVALRTPTQLANLERGFDKAPAQTASAEIQRMAGVNKTFRIIKTVEIALMLLGIALAVLLPIPSTGAAIGLGLLLEGSLAFVFDTFAHQRAVIYTEWLQGLAG